RRRHRPPCGPDDPDARGPRPRLGGRLRGGRPHWDRARDERLRPSSRPLRHAGAGRRRGGLRPDDRLRCPPDRGIRVPPLGGVAGSPGMDRAEGGHEHPLSRGPARLDGRQARPGPGLTPQGSPTIPRVDPRRRHQRELVVLAVTILGLSRLLDGPLLWLVAALVLVAVWLGARQFIAEGAHGYVPVPLEASIVPAVMAAGSLGALRLVPLGLALAPV